MAARGSEVSTVAERYAGALFDLARDVGEVESVEKALDLFLALMRESADLRLLVRSPLFASAEQQSGLEAIFKRAGIDGLVHNFLLVLAKNRRLFAIESVARAFKNLASRERGEVEADVITSVPLTNAQTESLSDTLRQRLGKSPKLNVTVDPKLLGGLIIKIGSQMIDTSLRTKLKNLEMTMKEAG